MKTKPFLWYLASSYSHKNPKIKQTRFVKISRLAGKLIKKGVHVLCPIASSVPIAKYGKIESTEWGYWQPLDINYLSRCDGILISMLDKEWYTSVGMRAEFEYALKHRMPVKVVDNKGNLTRMDSLVLLQMWDELLMTEEEVG